LQAQLASVQFAHSDSFFPIPYPMECKKVQTAKDMKKVTVLPTKAASQSATLFFKFNLF